MRESGVSSGPGCKLGSDGVGAPVAGAPVTFSVTRDSNGATLTLSGGPTVMTNAAGDATVCRAKRDRPSSRCLPPVTAAQSSCAASVLFEQVAGLRERLGEAARADDDRPVVASRFDVEHQVAILEDRVAD